MDRPTNAPADNSEGSVRPGVSLQEGPSGRQADEAPMRERVRSGPDTPEGEDA